MKKVYFFLLLWFLILTGCKSDKEKAPVEKAVEQKTVNVDKSQRLLNNITSAHNSKKFKSEKQVQFNLKLELKDSVFFDGKVILKTDGSKVKFLDANVDKVVDADNLKTDLDKKLFMIAELYAMGFWIGTENFEVKSRNDSTDVSTFKSQRSQTDFKIYSHPLTHVVQQVDFETVIDENPFHKGKLLYQKYITVNRVPVALKWQINLDQEQVAVAEISRISYPKTF